MKNPLLLFCLFISITCVSQSLEDQADKAFKEKEWEIASKSYHELIQSNPYDNFLYRIRYALSELYMEHYDKSIKAFRDFDHLNNKWGNVTSSRDWRVAWGLAKAYRGKEDADSAAYWYEQLVTLDVQRIEPLRQDDALKDFIGLEAFEKITGLSPIPLDRNSKWEKDLDFLRDVLLRSHYNPFIKNTLDDWNKIYDEIKNQIPRLDDQMLSLELSRLAALTDGHTYCWPMASQEGYQMLPLVVRPFSDGFFITATAESLKEYVGYEVLKIGDMEINEVVKKSSKYSTGHDNPMDELNVAPYYISTIEILQLIGAIDNPEKILVTLSNGNKIIEADFTPVTWEYEPFHSKFQSPKGWYQLKSAELPLWQTNQDDHYWFQYIPDENMVYFGFNNIINKTDELTIEAFSEEMFQFIEEKNVRYLVIDLRNNNGGSSDLYRPLLLKIATSQINESGRFYTIIGKRTYSAAVNFVSDLEYWTNTIFVGEPAGSSPNFIGEERYFSLPYSNLKVSVSDRMHSGGIGSTADRRIWIAPKIVAPMPFEDFANGIDPSMEKIMLEIGQ